MSSQLSLKLRKVEGEEEPINPTGLAAKILFDLQRFIACRKVMQKEHLVNNQLSSDLKIVVAHSKVISARVNLIFRSNTHLRPGIICIFLQQVPVPSYYSTSTSTAPSNQGHVLFKVR